MGLLYDELNRGKITDLWHGCLLFTDEYLLKSYQHRFMSSQRELITAVLLNAPSWKEVVVRNKVYTLKGGRGNICQEHFGQKGATYEYPRWFHASDELIRFSVHPKPPMSIEGLTIIDGFTPAVLLGGELGCILRGDGYILMNNAIERNFESSMAVLCLETGDIQYIG